MLPADALATEAELLVAGLVGLTIGMVKGTLNPPRTFGALVYLFPRREK